MPGQLAAPAAAAAPYAAMPALKLCAFFSLEFVVAPPLGFAFVYASDLTNTLPGNLARRVAAAKLLLLLAFTTLTHWVSN